MSGIKVRVWDSVLGEFICPDYLEIGLDGDVIDVFDSGRDVEDYTPNNDAVISQFTGMKDKNDTDIYVGDIILYGSEDQNTEVITFEHGSFGTKNHYLSDIMPVEVIGNIYENPELLEVSI